MQRVREDRFGWRIGALALGASLLLYAGSLGHSRARDDVIHLGNEARWQAPLTALLDHFDDDFWGEDEQQTSGLYRPLTAVTLHLTQALGPASRPTTEGLRDPAQRLVNVLLHALVAWSLALLALRLGVSRPVATALAALVVVHPLLGEPVLEIVSRSESQAALFGVGALAMLARGRTLSCAGAGVLWLAALLSKESAAGLLPALLLVVVWRTRELRVRPSYPAGVHVPLQARSSSTPVASVRTYTSVALLSIAAALVVYSLLRWQAFGVLVGLGRGNIPELDNPLVAIDGPARMVSATAILGRYLALLLWPARLAPDYSKAAIEPVASATDPFLLLGIATIVGALLWLAVALRRGNRAQALGIVVAAGTWLPASNLLLPVGTIMAERLFYLPGLGLLLASCAALDRLAARVATPATLSSARRALAVVLLLVGVALGVRSWVRVGDWQSQEILYREALAVVPDSARVQCTVGHHLAEDGRFEEARPHFERALVIHADYPKAHSQLARCLVQQGEVDAAIAHWRLAADHPHGHPDDVMNLSRALALLRPSPANVEEARRRMEELTREHPGIASYRALLEQIRRRPGG